MKNNLKLIERSRSLEVREPVETEFHYPASEHYVEPSAEDRAHLRKFLRSVRDRLWVVFAITALCTTFVAVYMAYQPDLYEAKAQVQVDLETVDSVSGSTKSSSFIGSVVNDPAYFNTQLQNLTSPRLLRRVVKSLNLESDPAFNNARSARAAGLANENPDALEEDARLAPYVEAIQTSLKAEPVKEIRLPIKETRLINISFSHPDRSVASKIVNSIADTFVLSNLERKTDANSSTSNILQERIGELQAQIRTQESQLLEYAKSHQILSLDPNQNTVVERLAGLNRQLLEAENERKLAEASYRAALSPGAAEALANEAAKDIDVREARLAELRQRRAQLLVENTEKWPEVKEVNRQIEELERQIREARERNTSSIKTNLETRYRQALAREQALRTAFNQQRGETLTQNEAAINYRIIQQEIETNKNLLDGMLQRSKENEAVMAAMRNNIHVNDRAVAPQAPIGPKRMLNTGIAFMLSLGFGIGLAVFLGYMDSSVRSIEDVEKALRLPTLAAIPLAGKKGRKFLPPTNGHKANGNGNGHHELLLNGNAHASITEAYRQLRTSMLLSRGRGGLKSLLFTSSVPGEGKTTMAVNTAISLAKTGALVLLIDADLRKPRLHKIFDLENETGLSTILADKWGDIDPLKMVEHLEKSKLDVLTSGPVMPDSTELLGSEEMRRLLSAFHYTYDFVVIDSPPIAYFADGVLLSALVDAVVLVVTSGESTRETARHAQQLLQDAGANIYGVVLNKVKETKFDYNYYYDEQD
jgi:capsular exopolysaccharide synthesis family protein